MPLLVCQWEAYNSLYEWQEIEALELGNLDKFAYVGGFSSAPNTMRAAQLIPDVEKVKKENKLLWMVCGGADGLLFNSTQLKAFCDEKGIPCTLIKYPEGKHDFVVWKYGLYNFAQLIF